MTWHNYLSSADGLFVMLTTIFFALEYFFPYQTYGANRLWFFRGALLLLGGVVLTIAFGFVVEGVFKTSGVLAGFNELWVDNPPMLNGLMGYLCVTFFNYWWHRFRHQSNWLWRVFHQVHHSTHRIQAAAAFYSHPFDYFSTVLIVNVVAYGVFGFDIESAAFTTAWVGVFEIWEHTNIRTPMWLGYLIARPEMHRIHHELGKHRNNYGLPLWDMLFGTYENSNRRVGCGFAKQHEDRLTDMLLLKDVHKR